MPKTHRRRTNGSGHARASIAAKKDGKALFAG